MVDVRSHGEGTAYQERNGRWAAVVTTAGGTRRKVYVPAREVHGLTRAQARRVADRYRAGLLAELEAGVVRPRSGLMLAAWLRSWIDGLDHANRRLRPATLRSYRMIVEQHAIPAIGHYQLTALVAQPGIIQDWLDGMDAAPHSIARRRDVLRRALNVAVRRRIIPANPVLAVELPEAKPRRPARALTADQARLLLRDTWDDRLHAFWALAIATGLRVSELLGLTWDDVDPEAGTVRVQAQLAYDKELGWVRVPVKAARKRERLALPAFALEAIHDHQLRMAAERTPEWRYPGHVFVTLRGDPLSEQAVLRSLKATLARLGLPELVVHELRHTSMTLLAEAGVPEDVRMARAGHSTRVMARRYAHSTDAQDRSAAAALERAVGGAE